MIAQECRVIKEAPNYDNIPEEMMQREKLKKTAVKERR